MNMIKYIIILCCIFGVGCENTTVYNRVRINDFYYTIICLDGFKYYQTSSKGDLEVKLDSLGKPVKCN
jgi:hypothetical protein